MDIEQMKSYFKNQNESEKLAKQVRDLIKTTAWQKQDMREGFKETFTPLIQSQESIKKSIDEQQNKTLEQLKKNQLALTDKENKLGELITAMLSITDGEKPIDDPGEGSSGEKSIDDPGEGSRGEKSIDDFGEGSSGEKSIDDFGKKKPIVYILPSDFNKNLYNKELQDTLKKIGYNNLPSEYFLDKSIKPLTDLITSVSTKVSRYQTIDLVNTADFKTVGGYQIAEPRNKNPRESTREKIKEYNTLITYLAQLNKLYAFKSQKGKGIKTAIKGSGINNYKTSLQLLDRLELLGGSILAGNNGVINEFSEIAHSLARMSVITKNQLNELLKNYVLNR